MPQLSVILTLVCARNESYALKYYRLLIELSLIRPLRLYSWSLPLRQALRPGAWLQPSSPE